MNGICRQSYANGSFSNIVKHFSFSANQELEFHDISNLGEVLLSYSVSPIGLSVLCMGESSNTLLFVYRSEDVFEVRRLDCSKSVPVLCDDFTKTRAEDCVNYILVARHAGMKLLVVAGSTFIDAHKLNSSEVAWTNEDVTGMQMELCPRSLSTDGHGHLYVVDLDNDCVHMFSLDDGSHMGVVLSEEGLSYFEEISWCDEKASLAVLCRKNGMACIEFCKIDHDDD